MKNLLKYSGILAAVIAIVGFILMLTTNGLIKPVENGDPSTIAGTIAIFGGETKASYGNTTLASLKIYGAVTGVIGFILVIVGIAALVLGFIGAFFKVKAINNIATILNLVAVVSLIVAGVLVFTIPAGVTCSGSLDIFGVSTDKTALEGYNLDVGFVFVAILEMVAGAFAALPTLMGLIKK